MWQPGKFTTEQRLAAAKAIAERLKDRYKEELIAVIVEGSTAKGLDLPESDLELSVVIKGGAERWYPFLFKGISVGIGYGNPEAELEAAGEIDYYWPVTGDCYETAQVIYDPALFYPRLQERNRIAVTKADFQRFLREALADMYEYVLKLFTVSNQLGAVSAASGAAYWAAMSVALANRYKFNSTRAMFEQSFNLQDLPQGYQEGMQELFSSGYDVARLRQTVGELWESFAVWAKAHGIVLDDDCLNGI